jgi:hypothetical protein
LEEDATYTQQSRITGLAYVIEICYGAYHPKTKSPEHRIEYTFLTGIAEEDHQPPTWLPLMAHQLRAGCIILASAVLSCFHHTRAMRKKACTDDVGRYDCCYQNRKTVEMHPRFTMLDHQSKLVQNID